MIANLAVVIPHYQRTAGVLGRTLAAVFDQDYQEPFTVIIVDDESPAPAAAEFTGLDDAARAAIQVIERKNGGPAAAKNTGLLAVPDSVEFVALLDCDDIWRPRHLARGMAAMRLGYDLFFGDHRREDSDKTVFQRCGISPNQHLLIDEESLLYQWQTDLFDACLHQTIIGLSTVLLRRAAFPNLKFAEDVGLTDDIYFAVDVARTASKVAITFSEDVLYTVADNVSVISDWRSNKSLRLILGLSMCYHKMLRELRLDDANRDFINLRIRETRADFSYTAISMLLRGRRIEPRYVAQFYRDDHALAGEMVRTCFNMVRTSLLGRR